MSLLLLNVPSEKNFNFSISASIKSAHALPFNVDIFCQDFERGYVQLINPRPYYMSQNIVAVFILAFCRPHFWAGQLSSQDNSTGHKENKDLALTFSSFPYLSLDYVLFVTFFLQAKDGRRGWRGHGDVLPHPIVS